MATLYFRNTGNTSWNLATNWSLTASTGAGDGNIPTNADDCIVNAGSGPTLNIGAAGVCKSINFTGYTGTLTQAAGLTVSGNVTLSSTMNITSTGQLIVNAVSTLTSNGKAWPSTLTLGTGTNTITLSDNWTVNLLQSTGTGAKTINGFNITVLTTLTVTININGTTNIILGGTGTWSGAQALGNTLTISTAGTITLSGIVQHNSDFTYNSGTVVTTGSTYTSGGAGARNITSGTIAWNNVNLSATGTVNLLSDMNITGDFTNSGAKAINGAYNINISGNLTMTNGTNSNSTAIFNLVGNGTWSGAGTINNPLNINTNGTITITGTVNIGGIVFIYVKGTVITTGSTLNVAGSGSQLSLAGVILNNIILSNTVTTFNNKLTATGTMTISATSKTLNGTGGFEVGTLLFQETTVNTITLLNSVPFIVNNLIQAISTSPANRLLIKSNSAVKTILTLGAGGVSQLGYVDFQNVDASGGKTINTFNGVITGCINVNSYFDSITTYSKSLMAA